MRTFSTKLPHHPSTIAQGRMSAKAYANREATEWDIRVDVNDDLLPSNVIANLRGQFHKLCYALVGGVELPDSNVLPSALLPNQIKAGSSERHVHVAIISECPINRSAALQFVRGPRKLGDEYAVPRNQRFTYAGWVAHHAKIAFKEDPSLPTILLELGDLPMDSFDEATCWQVVKIVKKFPSPGMRMRFIAYSMKLTEIKLLKDAMMDVDSAATTQPDDWDHLPPTVDIDGKNDSQ